MKKIIATFCMFLCIPLFAKNAGMLPYTYHQGTVYFLFGYEKRGASFVWTDFGGICDPSDSKDAHNQGVSLSKYCAAREATEETRYIFGDNKLPASSQAKKQSSIKNLLSWKSAEFIHDQYEYTQFFVEVPYIDASRFKSGPKVPNFEKMDYQWIKGDELLAKLFKESNPALDNRGTKIYHPLLLTLTRNDIKNFIKNLILTSEKHKNQACNLDTLFLSQELENLNIKLNKLNKQLEVIQ